MADRMESFVTDSVNTKKTKKPMMEKLRRERINSSLNEMKTLVLEALHRDSSRYSKMEKADILEMTVKYLRQIQFETRARKEVSTAADFRLVSNAHRGSARDLVSTHVTDHVRTHVNHNNSLQAPNPPSLAPLLPASSVAMAIRSNRTSRLVPYPSPPSSPTGNAVSRARLQHNSNARSSIVASPRVDNPPYPTERHLWRGW